MHEGQQARNYSKQLHEDHPWRTEIYTHQRNAARTEPSASEDKEDLAIGEIHHQNRETIKSPYVSNLPKSQEKSNKLEKPKHALTQKSNITHHPGRPKTLPKYTTFNARNKAS